MLTKTIARIQANTLAAKSLGGNSKLRADRDEPGAPGAPGGRPGPVPPPRASGPHRAPRKPTAALA